MVEMRKCSGDCGLEKELNKDNFPWRPDRGKFRNKCNVCHKISRKIYNQENKERIEECRKEYCEKNKEELSQARKKRYQENKEELKENAREYYYENRTEVLAYKKEYYQENKNEIKLYKKEHYKENEEYYKEYHKEWYQKNKKEVYEYNKQYRQKNKEEVKRRSRERIKNRRQNDPIFKLMGTISREINYMLKGKKAGKSTKDLIPFTVEQLIEHIETWFKEPGNEWMNWGNQGVYNSKIWDHGGKIEDKSTWVWNLDHIKPISHFKNIDIEHPETDSEFQTCWNLTNLRPLSAKQNILDGNRR